MSPVAYIDIIAAGGCIASLIFILSRNKTHDHLRVLVSGLASFSFIYYALVFVGWAGISNSFEIAEDIIGATLPLFWAFVFYGALNSVLLKALVKSKERFKGLVNNIPGAVYRCEMDRDWTMQFMSREIECISGYPVSDFIDNSIRTYESIIHPDDRQMVWEKVLEGIENKSPFRIEYRVIRKNGEVRWIDENGQATNNEQGEVLWLDGVMSDITDRRRAEQEREKVAALLESRNEEMQSLLHVTSHDLKSPLVNIQGFGGELNKACKRLNELIADEEMDTNEKKRLTTEIMEDISEDLHFIGAGTDKLCSLLDGLLKISRVSRAEAKIANVNIGNLTEKIRKTIAFQLKEKEIKLTVEELPSCKGDKDMTEHIFTNLIDNAIKYISPDRKSEITISGKIEKGRSVYCISDNGIGMPSDNLKKVFEIFYRLNPMDAVGGEGLGLTIVKRMLQLQNGDVWAESKEGQGSKFYVSLPNW